MPLQAVPVLAIAHSPMDTMDKVDKVDKVDTAARPRTKATRPRVMVTRLRVLLRVKDIRLKVKVTHNRATHNSNSTVAPLHP
jgi:hypothetical protein